MAPPSAPTSAEKANDSVTIASTSMPISEAAFRSHAQASIAFPEIVRSKYSFIATNVHRVMPPTHRFCGRSEAPKRSSDSPPEKPGRG